VSSRIQSSHRDDRIRFFTIPEVAERLRVCTPQCAGGLRQAISSHTGSAESASLTAIYAHS
jgi:hypothetical protein